jgi:hypothetical protein
MFRYIGIIIAFFFLTNVKAQHCFVTEKANAQYCRFMLKAKLDEKPAKFLVTIGASNYCRIWINGEWTGYSLPQTDSLHWVVNEYNIAKQLKKGINTLLIEVWNPREIAKSLLPTMLYFNVSDKQYSSWNKSENWLCNCPQDQYYVFLRTNEKNEYNFSDSLITRFASPKIMNDSIKEWKKPLLAKNEWSFILSSNLVHSINNETIVKVIYSTISNKIVSEKGREFKIQIAPKTKACFVFDRKSVSFGFPEVLFKQGNNAKIRLSYYSNFSTDSSKIIKKSNSYYDIFVSNGTIQSFIPSVPRSFRYLKLEIETFDNELIVDGANFHSLAYPFEEVSYIKTSNDTLSRIWADAQKMVQNASGYDFYDSLFCANNQFYRSSLLASDAIYAFDDSIVSRNLINKTARSFGIDYKNVKNYLSAKTLVDENFGLDWLSLLAEDYKYHNDTAFIHPWLNLAQHIVDYYIDNIQSKSHSVAFQLRCVLVIDQLIPLFNKYGEFQYDASRFRSFSVLIKKRIIQTCYNADKKLFADSSDMSAYSQYTNSLAILCGLVTHDQLNSLGKRIILDSSLLSVEPQYFSFLTKALIESGNGDLFYEVLKKIYHPSDTTNTESSYYKYISGLCSGLLKVSTNVSYFKNSNRFQIEPFLGNISKIEARVAIPNGAVYIDLKKDEKSKMLRGTINLPFKSKGVFIWKGVRYPLSESDTQIECPL